MTVSALDRLSFDQGAERHVLRVLGVHGGWVTFSVSGDTATHRIRIGDVVRLDVDGDGVPDLRVELGDVRGGRARLVLQQLTSTAAGPAATPDATSEATPAAATAPASGAVGAVPSWSALLLLIVPVAGAWWLLARRRRRRDDDEAQEDPPAAV